MLPRSNALRDRRARIRCNQCCNMGKRRADGRRRLGYAWLMQTILVPVDFSMVSKSLVAQAIRLARGKSSKVILLHVVQPPQPIGYPDPIILDMGPLVAAMIDSGGKLIMKLKTTLRRRGISARALQVEGVPVVEILACAKKLKADYIVIGSHGHSGFYDLLVGSTTTGVLRRATCPVVVVPAAPGTRARAGP